MQFSIGILVLLVIVGVGASDESCPEDCPLLKAPVCGTDGKTYPNRCSLRSVACRNQSDLEVAYKGECKGAETCETKRCKFRGKCKMNNGRAYCFCHEYDVGVNPGFPDSVCGTDNKTYANKFALKRARCKAQMEIEVAHTGKCPGTCRDCKKLKCGQELGEIKCVQPGPFGSQDD